MDRQNSEAHALGTVNLDIVERDMFQLLDRPGREHNPGQDGVDEEHQGVGYPSGHTALTLAARAAYGRTSRSATA